MSGRTVELLGFNNQIQALPTCNLVPRLGENPDQPK
jgi:hypothetical protein